ncbi:MAG: PSD1 domain-containing protein [Planctomycetaceae bacterium]|nr:PSD1 domain-containing protein [Planctomycetaceae bacterium]
MAFVLSCLVACSAGAEESVRYSVHIRPILQGKCVRCHGEATQKAELNLADAAGIRRGSEGGDIFKSGAPDDSRLLEVLTDGEMPPEGDPLTPEEIDLIRIWIEQGVKFDADTPNNEEVLNQHDVIPILLLRCATCHGRQTQEAGLDLRTKAAMLKGGKSGPAMVPGDPSESLLIKRIQSEEMPPRDKLASHSVKPVEPQELEVLTRWISEGAREIDVAPDLAIDERDPLVSEEDRDFWSLKSPVRSTVPSVSPVQNVGNPIDAFVLHRLEEVGLGLVPDAEREVLMRRAHFDLLGLPPRPEDVRRFVSDTRADAYERLIDRLLASPHYGERWGQYWLDLAGYADSEGVQHSDPVRPFAYRYRDYVIRSFNVDKPYDVFLTEQIAGDELADYEHVETITPELADNLIATGFLRMSADGTFAGITGFVPDRLDVIDDQIRILTSSVMGLTMRCARCHSHKFDPIPQRDYYRLTALLKPAMDEHDWLKPTAGGNGNVTGGHRYLPYVSTDERKAWEAHEQAVATEIEGLQAKLDSCKDDEELTKQVEQEIEAAKSKRQPEPLVRALWDRGEPSPTYLLRRGDYLQPGRLMGPGVPSLLSTGLEPFQPEPPWPGSTKTGYRLALARWLTLPNHPLTSRVIVNRIWRHHFGRGIVETLDDFGRAGARPTHPELLDWLSVEFVENGWSIKQLHRLIMTSATYRQSSVVTSEQLRLDPENQLLSRMPLRRLEAEALRDSLLAVAGRLDLTPCGPADGVEARGDGLVTSVSGPAGWRRSIYVQKRRTQRLTILDEFDRPRMSPNCVDRRSSTVAPQALHLMNNAMIHELSLSLSDRLIAQWPDDEQKQLEQLIAMTTGNLSSPDLPVVRDSLRQFEAEWQSRLSADDPSLTPDLLAQQAHRSALGNVCHAFMNSDSFLYID